MHNYLEHWEKYCEQELELIKPILVKFGFELDSNQPHLMGERYLMRAVQTASGSKLILLGKRISDSQKVVIKATSDQRGKKELLHEKHCREVLHKIKFAYQSFLSPQELLFIEQDNLIISIQTLIEQDSQFLDRDIKQQFSFALAAFEAQEGAHATTYEHARIIKKTFGSIDANGYLLAYQEFKNNITKALPEKKNLILILEKGQEILVENSKTIEQYCGFLTHTDFVPHNFRIFNNKMYLLDYSSLRFGNKYEGWARFLNFMALYNPSLEKALLFYVKNNRTPEEYQSLHLMRIFRLAEIIWYYTNLLSKTEGNLKKLNMHRVEFWSQVLSSIINNIPLEESIILNYRKVRDELRSDDEKHRQVGLH